MSNIVKSFFQRVVAVHPIIIKATGSVKLAILWDQIHYWSDKTRDPDGWVYKSQEELFDETGIKRRGIETARVLGKKLGVLDSEVRNTPPTVHYRVNEDAMEELIGKYLKKNPQKAIVNFKVKKEEKKACVIIELPEWMDKKVWSDWEEYRKEKKQKLTPMTIKQQIKFLEKNKADHIQIIQTSIQNGWRGLFEIKRKLPSDKEIRNQAVVQVKHKEQEWEKKTAPMTEEQRKESQKKIDAIRENLRKKLRLQK